MQMDSIDVAVTSFAFLQEFFDCYTNQIKLCWFCTLLTVNMIFQALDVLLDLTSSTNEQSRNYRHPDYKVDNIDDMRFLVDPNGNVSGNI